MKYSVWSSARRTYDYYDAPGDTGIHAGAPPRASTSELGATPEQAAWPLPAGAIKVGTGDLPQGKIASTDAGGFHLNLPKSILYAALGYLVWKVIK